MTVSTKPARISDPERPLVGLRGGGASAEARSWLESRLGWEQRLRRLEESAGPTPNPSAEEPDGGRKAG